MSNKKLSAETLTIIRMFDQAIIIYYSQEDKIFSVTYLASRSLFLVTIFSQQLASN